VLDVGFGSGIFLEAAIQQGWEATGVDVSEAAYAAASQHLGSRARLLVGDPLQQALAPASFDLVCFWDSLAHTPAPGAYLRWAASLLKPKGQLLIKTPLRDAAFYRWIRLMPKSLQHSLYHWPMQRTHLTFAGLAKSLAELGLLVRMQEANDEPVPVRGLPKQWWRHPRGLFFNAVHRLFLQRFPERTGLLVAEKI